MSLSLWAQGRFVQHDSANLFMPTMQYAGEIVTIGSSDASCAAEA